MIETLRRPLNIEGHCFGSDPVTHKSKISFFHHQKHKITSFIEVREEQTNKIPENTASFQPTSTTSSSSSSSADTPTKLTDTPEQDSESSKE